MPKVPAVWIECHLWYDVESRRGSHLSHTAAAIGVLVLPVPLTTWVFYDLGMPDDRVAENWKNLQVIRVQLQGVTRISMLISNIIVCAFAVSLEKQVSYPLTDQICANF